MKHIVSSAWKKYNHFEKVKCIVKTLEQSDEAHVEYFKGRSYVTTSLLGKGCPTPVDSHDEWNHVKITYQRKDALLIYDSILGPDGYFFDEFFSENENQRIKNAFAEAGFFTWQGYISKNTLTKPLLLGLILL
ncbi:MAG: hypothetical protein PVF58_18835 [Candidatus Methanofastidiosia archaeon]|jgi:hypothetical protein